MPALSREFAPYKPDPASLLHIAERWGMPPQEMVMIGDSAKDDVSCRACRACAACSCCIARSGQNAARRPSRPPQIVCGNRAGALTILLDEKSQWSSPEELHGEERPHFIARSLQEVQQVLAEQLELLPPTRPPQPLT